MSSNNTNHLLKIPFAARIIRFASQTLSDALRLATVTSVFEETIYDFKVGQGILHHFDECLAQGNSSNIPLTMKRTLAKYTNELDEDDGEMMSLFFDCFERCPDHLEHIKNGTVKRSVDPKVLIKEMHKNKFAAMTYDEKLEYFKNTLSPDSIRELELKFLGVLKGNGTNLEVQILADVAAHSGLCRIFRALVIDWQGFKNPRVGDQEFIFEKKPSSGPSTGEKSVHARTRFSLVDVLVNECFMAALRGKQKEFLKEFFGMFSPSEADGGEMSNTSNDNNKKLLADKIFWNWSYPSSETIRTVIAEHFTGSSQSDDDESNNNEKYIHDDDDYDDDDDENNEYVVKQIRYLTAQYPLRFAIELDYRDAIIDLVLHSSEKCDPYAMFFDAMGFKIETCFHDPIRNGKIDMVKFLVNDCKISISKLYSAENLRRNDVENNVSSLLGKVMSSVGVDDDFELYELDKPWQNDVPDTEKQLRIDYIRFFVIDSLPKDDLKARSKYFRHHTLSFRMFRRRKLHPSLRFPLELAGPKCWQCGEEFGFVFGRQGTCGRCGVVCCSKCKDSGGCPTCVIEGRL